MSQGGLRSHLRGGEVGPAGLPLRMPDPRLSPNYRGYSELPPCSSSWYGSASAVWGLPEGGWQPIYGQALDPTTVPTQ